MDIHKNIKSGLKPAPETETLNTIFLPQTEKRVKSLSLMFSAYYVGHVFHNTTHYIEHFSDVHSFQ